MKRWAIVIVAALAVVCIVVDIVREFFANETIPYFSSKPHHLLYVLLIAIAGGLVALAFDRLSPQTQRRVGLFAWGGAASTLTVFILYMAFRLVSISSFLFESGGTGWLLLALLLLSSLAAFLWFEFFQAWKIGVSQ